MENDDNKVRKCSLRNDWVYTPNSTHANPEKQRTSSLPRSYSIQINMMTLSDLQRNHSLHRLKFLNWRYTSCRRNVLISFRNRFAATHQNIDVCLSLLVVLKDMWLAGTTSGWSRQRCVLTRGQKMAAHLWGHASRPFAVHVTFRQCGGIGPGELWRCLDLHMQHIKSKWSPL